MAKKTATESKTADKGHAKRLAFLQEQIVDLCDRISDDPVRSFTARAIARRSVAPNVVEAAFDAMEEAVAAGRAAYTDAQKSAADVVRVARVDLTAI